MTDKNEKTELDNTTETVEAPSSGAGKPSLKNIVGSVLAAGIGVQSSKNRERDFQHGSFKSYVIGGIVFMIVFIGSVASLVHFVLRDL